MQLHQKRCDSAVWNTWRWACRRRCRGSGAASNENRGGVRSASACGGRGRSHGRAWRSEAAGGVPTAMLGGKGDHQGRSRAAGAPDLRSSVSFTCVAKNRLQQPLELVRACVAGRRARSCTAQKNYAVVTMCPEQLTVRADVYLRQHSMPTSNSTLGVGIGLGRETQQRVRGPRWEQRRTRRV